MNDWNKLSDRIINRRIFVSLYGTGDKDMERLWDRGNFNYCSSWADMGPIIERNKMGGHWGRVDKRYYFAMSPCEKFMYAGKDQLRVYAIVYLMMIEDSTRGIT